MHLAPTWFPTLTFVTAAPTRTATPASSCPGTQGKMRGPRMPIKWPAAVCRSVWQTPQNVVSISMSFGPRLLRARGAALKSQSVEVHAMSEEEGGKGETKGRGLEDRVRRSKKEERGGDENAGQPSPASQNRSQAQTSAAKRRSRALASLAVVVTRAAHTIGIFAASASGSCPDKSLFVVRIHPCEDSVRAGVRRLRHVGSRAQSASERLT
jgi:hypothetical protein